MKSQQWMKKALMLGAVFFISAFLVKPVGVSTQFSVLSGIIHSTIDPSVITEDATRESGYQSSNAYYDRNEGKLAEEIKHPLNYNFIFVLAIPLGGYLGYLFMKRKEKKVNAPVDSTQISREPKEKKNWLTFYGPSFLGGFLLLYGARMADGCTSGHMMSGMMQGSVSGYLFAGAVFAVAIPTAIVLGMRSKRKGAHN